MKRKISRAGRGHVATWFGYGYFCEFRYSQAKEHPDEPGIV